MDGQALPGARAEVRLAPVSRARRPAAMQVAVILAVLLHVLAGVAFVVRPPGFLTRMMRAPGAPPREAEVELVQNDMPATGDADLGGAGKDKTNQAVAQPPAAPPPRAAQPQPQAPEPPPSPDLPVGKDGEVAPPAPASPNSAARPRPPSPAQQQAQAAQPDQHAPPAEQQADIRLSEDDDAGMAGGSAQTEAEADPKAHNRLPAYPAGAGTRHEEGKVYGLVNVLADGTAGAVIVVQSSGSPELDSAAVKAWKTWRFKPAMDHGTAVTSQVPVEMNFVLRPGGLQ